MVTLLIIYMSGLFLNLFLFLNYHYYENMLMTQELWVVLLSTSLMSWFGLFLNYMGCKLYRDDWLHKYITKPFK